MEAWNWILSIDQQLPQFTLARQAQGEQGTNRAPSGMQWLVSCKLPSWQLWKAFLLDSCTGKGLESSTYWYDFVNMLDAVEREDKKARTWTKELTFAEFILVDYDIL